MNDFCVASDCAKELKSVWIELISFKVVLFTLIALTHILIHKTSFACVSFKRAKIYDSPHDLLKSKRQMKINGLGVNKLTSKR